MMVDASLLEYERDVGAIPGRKKPTARIQNPGGG
jgi:hypothetical protein